MALGIFGISEIFCGDILMHNKGAGKVSEFLEYFKFGFEQRDWIWSKFHLNEIWKFWTVGQKVFGEMECGYCHVVGVIFLDAEEIGKI